MRTILWFAMAACMVTFLVSGLQEPPWIGPTIAASVVISFVVILLPFTGRSGRAFRGAPIGIGTVVSVRRTGLTVGNRPELERVYNLVQVALGHLDAEGLRIAEYGLDARAVVLALRATGEIRGDRAVLELTLRVTRPDGSGFDVTTSKAVPPVLLPRVRPGALITVKYLPGDETTVALALPLHQ